MLEKPANSQYSLHPLLAQRWSPLAFSTQKIEPEKLYGLLEAARWAASSYNEQPWNFIMTTQDSREGFDRLLSCLAESNQTWAKQAPVLMLSVAKMHFEKNGKENRHAFHDVGAAACYLALQATAVGLRIHQMSGFDVEKARGLFQIPTGYEPVAAIAVGYQDEVQALPESLQPREAAPRSRKPPESFVFAENWGKSFLDE